MTTGSSLEEQSYNQHAHLRNHEGGVLAFRQDESGNHFGSGSYLPVQVGLRLSENAFRPSFASSVIASSAIWLSV